MASRGRGRRGRPRYNSQPPPVFDPQAFIEAMGDAVAIIAQASAVLLPLHGLVQRWAREGQITSRGVRYIILRHTWEEGTRWLGQL